MPRMPEPPRARQAGLPARPPPGNDGTIRSRIWRRFDGDEWAAFDALPPGIRLRLAEHAYEAWAVNAAMLWRHFRRQHADPARAERAMLRYLDHCERLERRAFAAEYNLRHGTTLPHDAAGVSVLRASDADRRPEAGPRRRSTLPPMPVRHREGGGRAGVRHTAS